MDRASRIHRWVGLMLMNPKKKNTVWDSVYSAQYLMSAVEGNLVKWHFILARQDIPWCYRLDLAIQVMELLLYFQDINVVHCDWKYDQVELC